ncbi:uncharacterized protein LOC119679912 [Teleopsis dalmanni]|uniref:uncharacterized protein LOC119679912 n=1 Tax=Teleopsis dalmanni TaxID=139649 RepID=UPI0018CD4FB8|nr:uncharacterized protein LOC119679912 [Teleopsis dalmanni]
MTHNKDENEKTIVEGKKLEIEETYQCMCTVVNQLNVEWQNVSSVAQLLAPSMQQTRTRLVTLCKYLIFRDHQDIGKKARDVLWHFGYNKIILYARKNLNNEYQNGVPHEVLVILIKIYGLLCSGIKNYKFISINMEKIYDLDIKYLIDFNTISESISYEMFNNNLYDYCDNDIGMFDIMVDKTNIDAIAFALDTIHTALLRLGDLHRYFFSFEIQNQMQMSKQKAAIYYLEAFKLNSSVGVAQNQLGILFKGENYDLDSIYHYLYSLVCLTPFQFSEKNVCELLTKHLSYLQVMDVVKTGLSLKDFFARFYLVVDIFFFDKDVSDFNTICHCVISDLHIVLCSKSFNITDASIFKIVSILFFCLSKLKRINSNKISLLNAFLVAVCSTLMESCIINLEQTILRKSAEIADFQEMYLKKFDECPMNVARFSKSHQKERKNAKIQSPKLILSKSRACQLLRNESLTNINPDSNLHSQQQSMDGCEEIFNPISACPSDQDKRSYSIKSEESVMRPRRRRREIIDNDNSTSDGTENVLNIEYSADEEDNIDLNSNFNNESNYIQSNSVKFNRFYQFNRNEYCTYDNELMNKFLNDVETELVNLAGFSEYGNINDMPTIATANRLGTSIEIQATANRPGTSTESQATANRSGTSTDTTVTANRPGTSTESQATANRSGTSTDTLVTANRPGTSTETLVTANRPSIINKNDMPTSSENVDIIVVEEGNIFPNNSDAVQPYFDAFQLSFNNQKLNGKYSNTKEIKNDIDDVCQDKGKEKIECSTKHTQKPFTKFRHCKKYTKINPNVIVNFAINEPTLRALAILFNWLRLNTEILYDCYQSNPEFIYKIMKLINYCNIDICTPKIYFKREFLQVPNIRTTLKALFDVRTIIPLSEDYAFKQFNIFDDIQKEFDWEYSQRERVSNEEECILRLFKLVDIGFFICKQKKFDYRFCFKYRRFTQTANWQWGQSKYFRRRERDATYKPQHKRNKRRTRRYFARKHDMQKTFNNQEKELTIGEDKQTIEKAKSNMHNSVLNITNTSSLTITTAIGQKLTKQSSSGVAEERSDIINDKVSKLEKLRVITGSVVTAFIILDTKALTEYIGIVKKLLATKQFVLLIPNAVIDNLDYLKKTSESARNVIRWLEQEFTVGNCFLRAQRDDEHLPLPSSVLNMPKKVDIYTLSFIKILSFCNYLVTNYTDGKCDKFGRNIVMYLSGDILADKQRLIPKFSLDTLLDAIPLRYQQISDYYKEIKLD